jgi:AcrR family transcriptional regulator
MAGRRARTEFDKTARRDDIVCAAARVVDRAGFDAFTMEAVATELDLVKGTLYRYFPTREALVLAVLRLDLVEWFDLIEAHLPHTSSDELAERLVESLIARPRLLELLAVLPSVLEHNVPFDMALDFKSFLLDRIGHVGATIDGVLSAHHGAGAQLLVRLNACLIGLYQGAHPSSVVRQVLDRPEFAPLRVDLADELTHLTHALVRTVLTKEST